MIANKRSELDVIADILRIKGSKTAIMYGANLSYAQTQRYIVLLYEAGFLQQGPTGRNGRQAYTPTEKGQKLLKLLEIIEDMLDESIKRGGRNASAQTSKRDDLDRDVDPFAINGESLPVHPDASVGTNGNGSKGAVGGNTNKGAVA